jgi:CDGSH-type Zn-finger protein/uncharacterized Fe-S cluster protein YjdI
MTIEIVDGQRVRILFDAKKCIHSRNCVLTRPDVFVPNVDGEWIHPERATPAEVAELAHQCPSGAIRYESVKQSSAEDYPSELAPIVNTAHVRENGPLAFHAALKIAGQSDALRATLCRCGHSANKPFCDGAHNVAGFQASGEPPTQESQALASRDGALSVTPLLNGPLQVKGSLELVSGTGRTINRVTETWLCRCGQSAKKPYCDGSHKKAGFTADGTAR